MEGDRMTILVKDDLVAYSKTPEAIRLLDLGTKTKSVLKNLDYNINKMRSEAAYLKEVSMTQANDLPPSDLPDSPHKTLDYRPSPRVFLSTDEIKNIRQ